MIGGYNILFVVFKDCTFKIDIYALVSLHVLCKIYVHVLILFGFDFENIYFYFFLQFIYLY